MLITPRFKPKIGLRELILALKPSRTSVSEFERVFARKFRAKFALAFPYGRSAQWCLLKALEIKNAEIIMPAYTCSVVAHAVTLSGNKPTFVDIDLASFNMNLEDLPKKITANTRAIIATHTFGFPQDNTKIKAIIAQAELQFGTKIWFINDCCHCFGAKHQGKLVSEYGDASIYAFNVSKYFTSIFGGMITTDNPEIARRVRKFREDNYSKASPQKTIKRFFYLLCILIAFRQPFYSFVYYLQHKTRILNRFTDAYHLDETIHFPPDYLEKMTHLEARVGLAQLAKLDEFEREKIRTAAKYNHHLVDSSAFKLPKAVDGATFSHYPVLVENRDKTVANYAAYGIEVGILIQYSIPHLSCYQTDEQYPNAKFASNHTINLPVNLDYSDKVIRATIT